MSHNEGVYIGTRDRPCAPLAMDIADDPRFAAVAARFGLGGEPDDAVASDSAAYATDGTAVPHDSGHTGPAHKEGSHLKRQKTRMSLAQLKTLAPRPELVEWEDATAPDPLMLVHMRAMPHTAPVPRHWNVRKRYLSTRRGARAPLGLPAYIVATGVPAARDAELAAEARKSAKVKSRDRRLAKTGAAPVDYERMHDAFFKHATRPAMTGHADIYWEGRAPLGYAGVAGAATLRPGVMGAELRAALGMSADANCPPPWLSAMQKAGPPPAYPGLHVPGVTPASRASVDSYERSDSFRWGVLETD